ncbi:aminopeptidase P family protein [Candidatus Woesearchaeota archaeon]|nr:aminopeptidase P family protein [Candidatus Woesearchaeota archaeon]
MGDSNLEQCLAKRKQAQEIMGQLDIPVWITLVADNKAEKAHLPLIGAPSGSSPRAYILTPTRTVAVSHDIELEIQKQYGFETIRMEGRNVFPTVAKNLASIVGENGVAPMAINYSEEFTNVDTLGHGSFRNLSTELWREGYFSIDKPKEQAFISADQLIFTIASTKLPYEIDLLREAAQVTNDVLIEGFGLIKSGMTEKNVADLLHKISDERISGNNKLGYSWEKERNPIVLTGEGIAGSPHMKPSDRVIDPGATVYIDFGLSVNGYHGDLQHFGYVLKDRETEAPEHVQKMFGLLNDSIKAGMLAAKPGVAGWEVDKASRDVIVNAGYPPYMHSTGHQLGAGGTHAPGVSFGPKFLDYTNEGSTEGRDDVNPTSQLPLRAGYVMTIEPRMQVANGASIEVDGVVTKNGFELFVPIQEKIHLIK